MMHATTTTEAGTVATESITAADSHDLHGDAPDAHLGRAPPLTLLGPAPTPPTTVYDMEEASSAGGSHRSGQGNGGGNDDGTSVASGSHHGDEYNDIPLVEKGGSGVAPTTNKKGPYDNKIILSKLTFGSLVFLLLILTVTSAYFVSDWFVRGKPSPANVFGGENDRNVPTTCQEQRQDAIDCEFSADDVLALEQEIDRLETANDVLAEQLDEYEMLNDRLNTSIQELREQNMILNENNNRYEELNDELSDNIDDLKEQNQFLKEQVDRYTNLNEQLNITSQELTSQVDRLEVQVDELSTQNDRLDDLVTQLSNETNNLEELNDQLTTNVNTLEIQIDELGNENDRLQSLVGDLQVVTSFLNETATNLDETYDDIAATLAEQITTNRVLVVESLQNTYHQRVLNWDCAFYDTFALEDFVDNGNLAIPDDKMNDVMEYVTNRVLDDLCLDTQDFISYMEMRYSNQDITTNRLLTSVQRYTWYALDYYFPEFSDNEQGLTPMNWANASYNCNNLESMGKAFTMDIMT